ncbi:hypothetical protein ACVDFE_17415 [Lentzea chajnantorensis]
MTLDLRTPEGRSYATNLRRRNAGELGPSSRVLVVDTTDALGTHPEWYERLARLPQVTGVVLVAVGPLDHGDGPVLRMPSALTGVGVTLWVNDAPGVPWEGGSQPPGAGRGESTVDDLLAALRFPGVFDRVLQEVRRMPHQSANPGVAVDYAAVEPGLTRALKLRALRQLVATGVAARLHDRESAELASVVRGATDGETVPVLPGSPLHEAMTAARDRVAAASRAVDALRGLGGLLGTGRTHRVVLSRLADAGEAVARYHGLTRRVLEDVDSSLAEGYPPPTELVAQGLPSPAPVNSVELADSLRKAVTTELAGGRTLPGLADQARGLGNQLGATRSLAVTGEVVDADAATWMRGLTAPPPFRPWPTPMAHLLPVVFVTCLLASWLPGMSWWPAAGLAVLWLFLVALLFARAPGSPAAGPQLAVTALVAAVSGTAGVFLRAVPSPGAAAGAAVAAGLGVSAVVAVVLGWNRAVDAWTAAVPVRRAAALTRQLTEQVTRTIEDRWLPADRNRRLADALLVVAGGLDAVSGVFSDVIRDRREEGGQVLSGDSSAGLADVLHHDLVAIALEVLRPSFEEIASQMPLSGDSHRAFLRAQDLMSGYNDHLDHAGLRELPPFVTDEGPRRRLAATLWRSSDASRRVLLLTERSRMTQLCAAEDIRLLQADGAVVLHFASADMDLPPADTGEVVRTRGDAVGALRLTPILARYVESRVHAVTEHAEPPHEQGEPR